MDKNITSTLDDLANQILKTQFEQLRKNAIKVKTAHDNAEAVHDMRVAARRLRAAIQTLKKILPKKARKIKDKLQKLGVILGKKRDLDVFYAATSIPILRQEIDQAQKQILSTLSSKWYAGLIRSLEKLVAKKSKKDLHRVAKKQIQKAVENVLEISFQFDPKVDDKRLHRLRIAVKKLRYTCEFFAAIFPLKSFIEKAKKIQDILGDHQDAITGIAMLHHYRDHLSNRKYAQITKRFELQKARTRKAFFKAW